MDYEEFIEIIARRFVNESKHYKAEDILKVIKENDVYDYNLTIMNFVIDEKEVQAFLIDDEFNKLIFNITNNIHRNYRYIDVRLDKSYKFNIMKTYNFNSDKYKNQDTLSFLEICFNTCMVYIPVIDVPNENGQCNYYALFELKAKNQDDFKVKLL